MHKEDVGSWSYIVVCITGKISTLPVSSRDFDLFMCVFCVFSLAVQVCVHVRKEYTGPSVTTATLDSSTSAAQDANCANATTTPPTATLSQVSPAHFYYRLKSQHWILSWGKGIISRSLSTSLTKPVKINSFVSWTDLVLVFSSLQVKMNNLNLILFITKLLCFFRKHGILFKTN